MCAAIAARPARLATSCSSTQPAEDAQQRVGLADGQVGRGAAGRGERDVLAPVQAEPGDHPVHQPTRVARQHPEVVTRGVGRAGGQRDLQVPHRAPARGARAGGELAVDPHGRGLAAVGLQDRARRAALLDLHDQPRAAPGCRRRRLVQSRRTPGRPTARRTRPRTGRRSRRARHPRRAGTRGSRRAPPARRRPASAPPGRSRPSRGCRSRRPCSAPRRPTDASVVDPVQNFPALSGGCPL